MVNDPDLSIDYYAVARNRLSIGVEPLISACRIAMHEAHKKGTRGQSIQIDPDTQELINEAASSANRALPLEAPRYGLNGVSIFGLPISIVHGHGCALICEDGDKVLFDAVQHREARWDAEPAPLGDMRKLCRNANERRMTEKLVGLPKGRLD